MKLITTITGSYPCDDDTLSVEQHIRRAILDQIDAGIDLLVDGQIRSDIAGIFAAALGIPPERRYMPFPIVSHIAPLGQPVTVADFEVAVKAARTEAPTDLLTFKAHVTGPTLLARSCRLENEAPYKSVQDPAFLKDIARVLAEEARFLQEAGADYIQIDAPGFAHLADLRVHLDALAIITRDLQVKTILHVCGDTSGIFDQLLDAPVDILNVEGEYLYNVPGLDPKRLQDHNKKLAYGCMAVNRGWEEMETVTRIKRNLIDSLDRFGDDNIWGITPNCGMRLSSFELAQERMRRLVRAARDVEASRGRFAAG